MFDEIVGDLINELDIFEITQIEGHSDEEIEISARATVETIKNLEFDKNDQWTKVTTVNKKKKVEVKTRECGNKEDNNNDENAEEGHAGGEKLQENKSHGKRVYSQELKKKIAEA